MTVFVLLAGITSYISNTRHENDRVIDQVLRKVKALVFPYVAATLFYHIASSHRFDLVDYLEHLIRFDITEPFYFIVFYLQLSIIGIFLYRIIKHTKYEILIACIALFISAMCVKYTYILPVWGGGQFLFGGSYLFIYTIGLILAKKRKTIKINNIKILFWGIGLVAYSIIYIKHGFYFDMKLGEPFGNGLNPPGITLMLYSILVFIFIYYLINNMQNANVFFTKKVIAILCIIGQNSYYIFLYHRLVLDYFLSGIQINNIWLCRVIYSILMIGVPIIIKFIFESIKKKYNMLMRGE